MESQKLQCDCNDWVVYRMMIDAPYLLDYFVKSYGMGQRKAFSHCPWCGNELYPKDRAPVALCNCLVCEHARKKHLEKKNTRTEDVHPA